MVTMTFEDYLRQQHDKQYRGTDDDMPDAYEAWLSDLQADDFMSYAEVYASKYALEKMEEMSKKMIDCLKYEPNT
jgi:hypothetical protein